MPAGYASISTCASSKKRRPTSIAPRNSRPMSWHFYKRRAVAHFQLQHYDKALESIAKAVELTAGRCQQPDLDSARGGGNMP